ncbi:hypothetical protein Biyabedamokiny2_00048 [Staphylococcus phage Biyabeda-mokiny_2]|nr:hypothetical protein Biyabedamokiny2_00048 [Staphylococcus phage Biyabeda-mokiny_2]
MLYYKKLLDKKMATVYGTVEIDKDGVVKGLTKEQEKEFANVPGFEFEEEKKTTRKSTARKTTAKKDENK